MCVCTCACMCANVYKFVYKIHTHAPYIRNLYYFVFVTCLCARYQHKPLILLAIKNRFMAKKIPVFDACFLNHMMKNTKIMCITQRSCVCL